MRNVMAGVVLGTALALLASPLGGCSATEAGSQAAASSEESTQGSAFGPVYAADETSDGLIAETIRCDAEDPYGLKDSECATATPVVYNYLVRIHRSDGSFTDVWVDPQPDAGRMFYEVSLRPVE